MANHSASMPSPVGRLLVTANEEAILAVSWEEGEVEEERTPLLDEALRQLALYFAGRLTRFDLPLQPKGSPFDRRVWEELRRIPYGERSTYGALARRIGSGPRPVGGSLSRNPIPIIIPCHRVLARSGLGGYSGGEGLPTKEKLLALEGATVSGRR